MNKIIPIIIIAGMVLCIIVLLVKLNNYKETVIAVSEELEIAQEEAKETHPIEEKIEEIIETIAPEKIELRQETLEELFEKASKLISMEYSYTNASEISDYRELFSKVKFAEETYVFTYDGKIQAGIDLSKIKYDKIDNDKKTVHITLPPPEILSHELDMESFKFYGVKQSLLGSISLEEYTSSLGKLKKAQEDKLENKQEFYHQVSQNAKLVLETLFANAEITNEYTLKIDVEEYVPKKVETQNTDTASEIHEIQIPLSSEDAKGKDYEQIRNQFKDAGFKNVTVEAQNSSLIDGFFKSGKVIEVTINGVAEFRKDDMMDEEAIIKVYYASIS